MAVGSNEPIVGNTQVRKLGERVRGEMGSIPAKC